MTICYSFFRSLLLIGCLSSLLVAETISGHVHNQTTGQPAAGDMVVLLRLAEGMQEESHTTTDAQGAFLLNKNDVNAPYVVRVLHQGVNYDQTVTGSAPLELKVFDAVSTIPGLSGNLGIVQFESDENRLKVTEMFAITNASTPPVTQSSPQNFEISVPDTAAVSLAEVKGPGGIWVKVSPIPVPGRKNVYRVNFPLRPGDTLFKFNYDLAYSGHATFHLKVPYPIKNLAVAQPESMFFKAVVPGTFQAPVAIKGQQVEKVVQEPVSSDVPPFEISGMGKIAPSPDAQAASPAVTASPQTSRVPQQNPATAVTAQSRAALWLMLAGIVAILALGVFAVWRVRKNLRPAPSKLEALKEELFRLESDRLRGKVSKEKYAATKKALNQSIQQLLDKQSGQTS